LSLLTEKIRGALKTAQSSTSPSPSNQQVRIRIFLDAASAPFFPRVVTCYPNSIDLKMEDFYVVSEVFLIARTDTDGDSSCAEGKGNP